MAKRVLVIVLLVVVALFAYVGYNSYDTRRAGSSGQVFSGDSSRPKVDVTRSSRSATAQPDTPTQSQDSDTIVYPAAVSQQATQQPAAAANGGTPLVTQSQQAAPAAAPGSDTISPNPPNGMVFAGSGRYQLYRQGNLTWRLDTETGRSCVIFATDEEWKKPRVFKAGCGRS